MREVGTAAGVCVAQFRPILILEVELSDGVPAIRPETTHEGIPYTEALSLVRLHGQPLGLVRLAIRSGGTNANCHAAAIWSELSSAIRAHLRADGLAEPHRLDESGLPCGSEPLCDQERRAFLDDPPYVSIIIPTRDRPDRLRTALDSILGCEYPQSRYEIVVVDNASTTNGTAELLSSQYAVIANIRHVVEERPGSASARNRGLRDVDSEFVLFTDDDVRVDRRWITETTRAFGTVPGVGGVAGLLLPMRLDTPAQLLFEEYGGFTRGFERVIYDLEEYRPSNSPLYPFAAGIFGTGNNFSFRRSTLSAIGDFDPALGNGTPALGGVDSEVLLRTILAGHRIVYEPASIVYHLHRTTYAALRRQVYSYGVGLTAYLLKTMAANPRLLPGFARKLPGGLRFALSSRSSKNSKKSSAYPRELTRLELRGMLYGPLAYRRSRRVYGPHRRGYAVAPGTRRASRDGLQSGGATNP